MRTMKKWVSMATAAVLAASLLAGCGNSDASSPAASDGASNANGTSNAEKIKIGFVVKSLSDQYWVLMKAGAEKEAAAQGVDLKFIAPNSESDVQAQVDMMQNLIGQKIQALCVAPSSDSTVQPVLQQADQAGIKILAVDTDTAYENKLTFIGTGNESAAKLGGEFVAKTFKSGAAAIVLRGRLGDKTHDEREAGWAAALEAAGIKILEVQAADSQAEKALNVTQDLLAKYSGKIDVICTTADSMAQGAQNAVQAAGANTVIMGFDGTIPVAEGTAKGDYMGTVAQDPYKMGVLAIQEAVKAVKGETIEKRIDSGATVISKENAQSYVDQLNKLAGN